MAEESTVQLELALALPASLAREAEMDRNNKSPSCAAPPAARLRRRPPLARGACHAPSAPRQPAGAARSKA